MVWQNGMGFFVRATTRLSHIHVKSQVDSNRRRSLPDTFKNESPGRILLLVTSAHGASIRRASRDLRGSWWIESQIYGAIFWQRRQHQMITCCILNGMERDINLWYYHVPIFLFDLHTNSEPVTSFATLKFQDAMKGSCVVYQTSSQRTQNNKACMVIQVVVIRSTDTITQLVHLPLSSRKKWVHCCFVDGKICFTGTAKVCVSCKLKKPPSFPSLSFTDPPWLPTSSECASVV